MAKEVSTRSPAFTAAMARATGEDRSGAAQIRVPPPADAPDMSNRPPLPAGRLVVGRSPASLTPAERSVLERVGWDDTMPLADNMGDIVAQAMAERAAECDEANIPPPIPLDTPPIKVEPIPYARATPDQKEQLRKALLAIEEQKAIDAQAAAAQARIGNLGPAAGAVTAMAQQALARPAGPPKLEVADDRPDPQPAPQPAPRAATQPQASQQPAQASPQPSARPGARPGRPAAQAATAPQQPERGETGAAPEVAECPHCKWPLGMPDVPEPEYEEKMAFLHSVLGQRCHTKDVPLFDGNVVATFRTLTTREIDEAYKQAYRDKAVGRIETTADFWERVNRYRLLLQLVGIRTATATDGFVHDLPDGLSPEANPIATCYWDCDTPAPGETVLPAIEEYIVSNVLRTEQLFRVVNAACNHFNRVNAKLEAMVDHSDFWRRTGAQS